MINYKSIALQELVDYSNQSNNTLAEDLYSFLREKFSGVKEIKEIRTLDDQLVYELIEKAKDYEKDE